MHLTSSVVLVQEAERKIPINYANRYRNAALSKQSYLPFKVRVALAVAWRSTSSDVCLSPVCRAVLRVVLACDRPRHVDGRDPEDLPSLGKGSQSRGHPGWLLRQPQAAS